MIWRTRFSSLAVSTRPQNETVSSKCSALQQRRQTPPQGRIGHPEEKVQRNLTRLLYGANGQSPEASEARPLVRGTELPTVTLNRADIAGDGKEFGAFSPSALISIRQRLNMNAVRLPVSALGFEESGVYRARVREVVESANRFELLVILAADPAEQLSAGALAHFWERWADEFKGHPNVFFAPGHGADLVDAIRSAGAEQPVLVAGEFPVRGRNLGFEVTPSYATTRTDEDRWRQFGSLSTSAPVMVR